MSEQVSEVECPNCGGKGHFIGMFPKYAPGHSGPPALGLECHHCSGTGKITAEMLAWINRGRVLSRFRIQVLDEGPRECADRIGMKASELSYMEQGTIDNSDFRYGLGSDLEMVAMAIEQLEDRERAS